MMIARSRLLASFVASIVGIGSAAAQQAETVEPPWDDALPPGTAAQVERSLDGSTRHGEWVDIELPDGAGDLLSWVVYPERAEKAGVVLVVHDIRGMSDWIRAVADQLAQDGFIAIVPDFLSGKGPDGGGTESLGREVGQAIRKLGEAEVVARLDAAKAYGESLPASNGSSGVLGFCWGGTQSFLYALAQPQLGAAVVFYGNVPGSTADSVPDERIAKIAAPVLGLYGGRDARINATLPPTIRSMMDQAKTYAFHSFEGAGHGFVSHQGQADGANHRAARHAWPIVLDFLRRHLDG